MGTIARAATIKYLKMIEEDTLSNQAPTAFL
jgi:hypothetical protein